VTVKSDHHSLQYFFSQRTLSKRQVRWMEELADFDLTIKYVRGDQNGVADALSRRADMRPEEAEESADTGLTLESLGWQEVNAVRRRAAPLTEAEVRENKQRFVKEATENLQPDDSRPPPNEKGAVVIATQRCTATT